MQKKIQNIIEYFFLLTWLNNEAPVKTILKDCIQDVNRNLFNNFELILNILMSNAICWKENGVRVFRMITEITNRFPWKF